MDFRPGCHDCRLERAALPWRCGDRESTESLGVALASVEGETQTPLCMNGFVGDGDLDDIVWGLCIKREGDEGVLSPRRIPPGKLRD